MGRYFNRNVHCQVAMPINGMTQDTCGYWHETENSEQESSLG